MPAAPPLPMRLRRAGETRRLWPTLLRGLALKSTGRLSESAVACCTCHDLSASDAWMAPYQLGLGARTTRSAIKPSGPPPRAVHYCGRADARELPAGWPVMKNAAHDDHRRPAWRACRPKAVAAPSDGPQCKGRPTPTFPRSCAKVSPCAVPSADDGRQSQELGRQHRALVATRRQD